MEGPSILRGLLQARRNCTRFEAALPFGGAVFLQIGALMRELGLFACLRTSRVLRASSKRVQHDGCLRAKCVEMIEDDRRCTRDCVMFKGAQEIA